MDYGSLYYFFSGFFGGLIMALKRCEHYSIQNMCCSLLYLKPIMINLADIDPVCRGYKSEIDCTYYMGYHLDIAGNDSLMKKHRDKLRKTFEWLHAGESNE